MKVVRRHTADTTANPKLIGAPYEVEFDKHEELVEQWYEMNLNGGMSTTDAARKALSTMPVERLSQDFVSWLSDGTLRLVGYDVVDVTTTEGSNA